MTTPESDARNYLPEDSPVTGPIIGYRNPYTGEEIGPDDMRFNEIHKRHMWKEAPPLNPREQQEAAIALQEMLDTGQLNYPNLARTMLQRPESLWLWNEMGFQLNGGQPGNEPANSLAAESVEAILYGPDTPDILATYQESGQVAGVAPRFWYEVANYFDGQERDIFAVALSRLKPDSADRVASRMMVWAQDRDMDDPATRELAVLNFHQMVLQQQQSDLGEEGANPVLNALRWPVKHAKLGLEKVISHGIYHFGSPEDAVRRRGLSPGEQFAYQIGLRPKDDFGEMGAWHIASGLVDAQAEIGLDPLNLLAGLGVTSKAIKTIPMAQELTTATRIRYATRALFAPTRRFAGIASDIKGGRMVRAQWVLGGKTFDQMLQSKGAVKAVKEIQGLLKAGKVGTMYRRFPQFADLPEEAVDILTYIDQTPEDALLTLRMVAMNDAFDNTSEMHRVEMALTELATDARRKKYGALLIKAGYSDEEIELLSKLKNFEATQVLDEDYLDTLTLFERAAQSDDKVLGSFEYAGDTYTVYKAPARAAKAAPPTSGRAVGTQWDELADDQVVEVYHVTSRENAERFAQGGILPGEKDFAEHATRLTDDGIYVSSDAERIFFQYGGQGADTDQVTIAIRVRKGDITISPEATGQGRTMGEAMLDPTLGGVVKGGVRAEDVRIVDDIADLAPPQPFRDQFRSSLGQADTWYVRNEEGLIVGGYNSSTIVGPGDGVMHQALDVAEAAGDSWLPTMMRRADSPDANFSEAGARYLRNAIDNRLGGQTTSIKWLGGLEEGMDPKTYKQLILESYRYEHLKQAPHQSFFIVEALRPPRRVFSRAKFYRMAPGHRGRSAVSRLAARTGRIDSIDVSDSAKGAQQLGELFEHYGLRPERVDRLIQEFIELPRGARQNWIFRQGLTAIAEDRGIGALKYDLLRMYDSMALRQFSNTGADLIEEGGRASRVPLYPHQMSSAVPIPVEALDDILGRSKRARWPSSRGLWGYGSDRKELAGRFQAKIKREFDVDVSDEEAWHMAYSMFHHLNPDARGWSAGKLLPRVGSLWDKQHQFFTTMMLLGRPFQWSFRVTLEEQWRAFINNTPSLGRNPFEWMWGMRQGWLLSGMAKRRQRALTAAAELHERFTVNAKTSQEIYERLAEAGLASLIFPDGVKDITAGTARRRVGRFIDDALQGRTTFDPLKDLAKNSRRDAKRMAQARKILDDIGLGHRADDFDFDEMVDIRQAQIENLFIADQLSVQSPHRISWEPGMSREPAMIYGKRHSAHIAHNFVEDEFGRLAVRRKAARFNGLDPEKDPALSSRKLVEHKSWDWMATDQRIKHADAADEVEVAERYLELLDEEVEYLLAPFLANKTDAEKAALLEDFIDTRVIKTTIGRDNVPVELNYNNNFGGVGEKLGELVADTAYDASIKFPPELVPVRGDPRFTEVSVGPLRQVVKRGLAFFGDDISQALNRRPAWIKEQGRWYRLFKRFGVPDELAADMANKKAVLETNNIFFNPDTAPHIVQKLNRYIPFFKAFYEVVGQWTYKMPVAIGGNWMMGAPEFVRKIQRIMDALVDTGIATRTIDENGELNYTYTADWLPFVEKPVTFNLGDPLDPDSFGALSFLQFSVGLNPIMQVPLGLALENIPAAGDDRRDVSLKDETIADMARRFNVSETELIRLNRDTLINLEEVGNGTYLALKTGVLTPAEVTLPRGTPMRLPDSSLFAAIKDFALPFGTPELDWSLPIIYVPTQIKNVIMTLGLHFDPALNPEGAYDGDFGGINTIMPEMSVSSLNSQMAESFMYLEATDRQVVDGQDMGPLQRLMHKETKVENETDLDMRAELEVQLEQEREDYLQRVFEHTAGTYFLKTVMGIFTPTSPQFTREEADLINQYWGSREAAEALQTTGQIPIHKFNSVEEIEQFWEMVGEWLFDPTGEGAKATFARNNPTLLAYLTPKTYYGPDGPPPDIYAFSDYMQQVKDGERVVGTAAITSNRYYKTSIEADFNNEYIAKYGNDPVAAAAAAVTDREGYQEMQQRKSDRYVAQEWFDDLLDSPYQNYLEEKYQDDNFALDAVIEQRREVQNALSTLLEVEEGITVGLDVDEIRQQAPAFRFAIAVLSDSIRNLETIKGEERIRNPFEKAYNDYFEKVYLPYNQRLSTYWDRVEAEPDDEKAKLIFEEIRDYQNLYVGGNFFTDTSRPDVAFPSPLDYQWSGKDEDEKSRLRRNWLTRPLEWMNLHQAAKLVKHNPGLSAYLPTTDNDMEVYQQYTLMRLSIDEAWEANEIGRGDRMKALASADEWLRRSLYEMGRGGEVEFMDMTPFQKLHLANELPYALREYSGEVEWFIEALAIEGKSADSDWGRLKVEPLVQKVITAAYQNEVLMEMLQNLGESVMNPPTVRLDKIVPWLFFDAEER